MARLGIFLNYSSSYFLNMYFYLCVCVIHVCVSTENRRSRRSRGAGVTDVKWKLKGSLEGQLDGVLLGQTREGMFSLSGHKGKAKADS